MLIGLLDAEFSSFMQIAVWCFIPLYGSFLGLTIPFLPKTQTAAAAIHKSWANEGPSAAVYYVQILFFVGSLLLLTSYRGHTGPFCQGQLVLTQHGSSLSLLVLCGLGLALAASVGMGAGASKTNPLGFSMWYLGPTLSVLWSLLPLTTQLTTSLLILELVGVGLVWALSSATSGSNPGVQSASTTAPGLVYALMMFVWASGMSALALLSGLGLATLEGGVMNFMGCKGLANPDSAFMGVGEGALTLVLLLKFLMGGGQFLLLAWYSFLPSTGLMFYLFFYYPAHLIVGTTFFLGFFLSSLSIALGLVMAMLVAAALALLPHLGAQASPSLTLAGSSFVGLSFLAMAMLNVPV